LVASLTALERRDEARRACLAGLSAFPEDPELLFRQGLLAQAMGCSEEAEEAYRGALANRGERHFSSVDPGVLGYKARHNLALVYRELGQEDLAELQWRHIVAEAPAFREGQQSLGESLLRQRRYAAFEVHVENMLTQPPLLSSGLVLKAQAAEGRGQLGVAREALEQAVSAAPEDIEPLRALCRFLFGQGDLHTAEQALHKLLVLEPDDGAAHTNLGVLYLRGGKTAQAVAAFRASVRVRPNCAVTWDQLAVALEALGQTGEAAACREQAQRLSATSAGTATACERSWSTS
jgi:O-antigen biosynthesis protein